jgi:hypothetical protein
VRNAIQPDGLPDDVRVSTETLHPEPVTDQRDVVLARLVLFRAERTPEDRLDPEDVEEIGADEGALQPNGRARTGQRHALVRTGRDIIQRVSPRAQVQVIGRRHVVEPGGAAHLMEDADELLGMRIGQRPQEHRVDHGEDRRVGADAQGQRHHGGQSESGRPGEPADGVAQVLQECLHRGGLVRQPCRTPAVTRPSIAERFRRPSRNDSRALFARGIVGPANGHPPANPRRAS